MRSQAATTATPEHLVPSAPLARALVALSIALLVWCACGHRGNAQDQPLVDNVFYQTDLRQAIEDIAAQANVNIIADPGVQGLVSVAIENATVDEALKLLLAGTEYDIQRTDDYYLVFTPDIDSDSFTDVATTRVFQLSHVNPETARSLLARPLQRFVSVDPDASRLVITAPREAMQRIEEDLLKIDSAEREDTVFMALNHIRVANARALLPAGLQNYVRVDPDRNTVAITGPVAQRTRVIGQLRRLDIPLPPVAVDATNLHRTHVVKLNNVSPETAVNLLPDAAAAYVRGDDASGAVAVSAPKHLVDELIADIRRIDVKRQHVMLDARVVVLEQSDLLNFGTNFNWPTIQAGSSYMDGGDAYEVRIGYTPSRTFTDALQLTLNLLSANQEATILASPQVLAQDGVESEIRVTNEEYFQITAPEGNFIQSDLEKIETGTILSITPRIGDDGSITLSLELEVSDVVARGQQDLPVVNRRAARSTIQLENGGTAAVAGLVDNRSETTETGVPGARRLPFLGRAFRTDRLTHRASQVAIFITATLIKEGEDSFAMQRPERGPLPRVDETTYRGELERALQQLGVSR